MRERVRNFWIGLTTIVAMLGLAVMLFLFGELEAIFDNSWRMKIEVVNANGLRKGSMITMYGVPIGQVVAIEMHADPAYPVRILASIEPTVNIPENVRLYSASALISTRTNLQLVVPDVAGADIARDGTGVLRGTIGSQMFEEITAQLDRRMTPILESLSKFNDVASAITAVTDDVAEMVRPQTSDELAAGAPANLRTATDRIARAVANFDDAVGSANEALQLSKAWLGDEQLRLNVNDAVAKATTLIEEATTTMSTYTALAASIEGDSTRLVHSLIPVADDASTTLEEIRRVLRLANEGDGTVGRLLRDPDLYNSLDDAAVRLERLMVEVQLLVEKIKAEGVKIGL
jgi:phospholipid/cholesterol/gamma-HCH transport system substrate-binding protein